MGTDMTQIFEISASDCAFEVPDAWCGDPRAYDEHQRQASEIFMQYPEVLQLHFDTSDTGVFLTRASQHDPNAGLVVGAFHERDYYAYQGGEQVRWQFVGIFIVRHYCWLKWRSAQSGGELACLLPRIIR